MGQNGIVDRLRGSFTVKTDERGRIKIPQKFLSLLESRFGREVYLTSLNGDFVLFYPLPVWKSIEARIESLRGRGPEIEEYVSRTSYWGTECEFDPKGRILIPQDLRNSCGLQANVLLLGIIDHLVVWNSDRFREKYLQGPFGDESMEKVARLLNETMPLSGNE